MWQLELFRQIYSTHLTTGRCGGGHASGAGPREQDAEPLRLLPGVQPAGGEAGQEGGGQDPDPGGGIRPLRLCFLRRGSGGLPPLRARQAHLQRFFIF